jgi:hypothetical protein
LLVHIKETFRKYCKVVIAFVFSTLQIISTIVSHFDKVVARHINSGLGEGGELRERAESN